MTVAPDRRAARVLGRPRTVRLGAGRGAVGNERVLRRQEGRVPPGRAHWPQASAAHAPGPRGRGPLRPRRPGRPGKTSASRDGAGPECPRCKSRRQGRGQIAGSVPGDGTREPAQAAIQRSARPRRASLQSASTPQTVSWFQRAPRGPKWRFHPNTRLNPAKALAQWPSRRAGNVIPAFFGPRPGAPQGAGVWPETRVKYHEDQRIADAGRGSRSGRPASP